MAFPGMGLLSMLGGSNNPMSSMGGFGQMLGDFLKSPSKSSANSSLSQASGMVPGASAPPPGGRQTPEWAQGVINQGIARQPQYADFLRRFLPGGTGMTPRPGIQFTPDR